MAISNVDAPQVPTNTTSQSESKGSADRPILGHLSSQNSQFQTTVEKLRQEIAPRSILEQIDVDLAVLGLVLLRQATEALTTSPLGDMALSRVLTQGHKVYQQALKTLRKRDFAADVEEPAAQDATPEHDDEPPKILRLPVGSGSEAIPPLPNWRDRIVFPRVTTQGPESWPRVRDTDLDVEHLMSLVDAGWTSVGILSFYPQLDYDDLRACMGCDLEGLAGPPPA